jgi:biopolymer transport protein ExbB
MNFTLIHDAVLLAMAAVLALALAVIIERLIYYGFVGRAYTRLVAVLSAPGPQALGQALAAGRSGPHVDMLKGVQGLQAEASSERVDLQIQALYLAQQAGLRRWLWIVDTAITLSPLLGLLGTILGIIDTFSALAAQGVSDPQAVSRGIGTALMATAAGIGVAVFCLVFNNFFNERVERVNEQLKVLALQHSGQAA